MKAGEKLEGERQVPQVVSHNLSDLTSHSKSVCLRQEKPPPTEDARRLSSVLVSQERIHIVDQLQYVQNSMTRSINALQATFLDEPKSVISSEEHTGPDGVGLAGSPCVVWQIFTLKIPFTRNHLPIKGHSCTP